MKTGNMRLLIAEWNFSIGTETVALGLIPELAKQAECVVWALPQHRAEFYKKSIPSSEGLIYEELYWPQPPSGFFWRAHGLLNRMDRLVPRSRFVPWLRSKVISIRLKQLIRKHRITHFFTPWIFNVDFNKLPVPMGAMAMDLNWQHFPDNFTAVNRPTLDRLFEDWLAQADVVFPISDFTADEMRRAFPNSAKHLKVVPHGAQVIPPAPLSPPPGGEAQRKYFYYPGSAFEHKDHGTVIEAALELYARGCDFDLVFSGGRTEAFLVQKRSSNAWTESIRALIAKNTALINGRFKILGKIDWDKVETLFQKALTVVLPSRFEGFGLPLLEAIERGKRVICSDIPPFLEQIQRYDYGAYTSVFSVGARDQLAQLMESALNAPTQEQLLPAQIAARSQRWTWKDAAAAYVEALHQTGARPSP